MSNVNGCLWNWEIYLQTNCNFIGFWGALFSDKHPSPQKIEKQSPRKITVNYFLGGLLYPVKKNVFFFSMSWPESPREMSPAMPLTEDQWNWKLIARLSIARQYSCKMLQIYSVLQPMRPDHRSTEKDIRHPPSWRLERGTKLENVLPGTLHPNLDGCDLNL